MKLDAAQVQRALMRIARGSDTRPPAYHKVERYVRTDGTLSNGHWKWDISGDCLNPVYREMYGRPYMDKPTLGPSQSRWLEVRARCRTCEKCLAQRGKLWRGRLLGELRQSQSENRRSWFVTLTANPTMRTYYKMKANQRFIRGGKAPKEKGSFECTDFENTSEADRFRMIHREISRDITLFLKRLRSEPVTRWRRRKGLVSAGMYALHPKKEAKRLFRLWVTENPCPKQARIRYVIVTEAHKAAEVFPHYHILIHECDHQLTADHIKDQWRSRIGFIDRKLVKGEPEAMLYLCKYLTKSSLARVRASNGYGRNVQTISDPSERVATATPSRDRKKRPYERDINMSKGHHPFFNRTDLLSFEENKGITKWFTQHPPTEAASEGLALKEAPRVISRPVDMAKRPYRVPLVDLRQHRRARERDASPAALLRVPIAR